MREARQILHPIQQGNAAAASELLPLVYAEFRQLARFRMRKERLGATLNPTALVHEVYIRLAADEALNRDGRSHLLPRRPKPCAESSSTTPVERKV